MKILVFKTQASADQCLAVINAISVPYWESQGYKVEERDGKPVVIGKNALTGEDDPNGITTTWDTVKESPDKRFYIADPAAEERYSLWLERATEAGYSFDGEAMEYPDEWSIET